MASNLHIGETLLENLYLGDDLITKIYLGEVLIYEETTTPDIEEPDSGSTPDVGGNDSGSTPDIEEEESLFPVTLSTGSNGQTGIDVYNYFISTYTANKPNNTNKNNYTKTNISEELYITSNVQMTNVNTYVATWGKKTTANGIIFSNGSSYYVLGSDGKITKVTF